MTEDNKVDPPPPPKRLFKNDKEVLPRTKIKVTDPKVIAGGLGASLATNVILVVQEFYPYWEPSAAFVGAVATLAGLTIGWLKRNE